MSKSRGLALLIVGTAAGLVLGGFAIAQAATTPTVKVCVTKKAVVRAATSSSKCPKGTRVKLINVHGPRGLTGAPGSRGEPGSKGSTGEIGPRGEPGAAAPAVTPTPPTVTTTSLPASEIIDGGTP